MPWSMPERAICPAGPSTQAPAAGTSAAQWPDTRPLARRRVRALPRHARSTCLPWHSLGHQHVPTHARSSPAACRHFVSRVVISSC
jgi:hypothetical protein